jgi:hypothetical protein
VAGQLEPLRIRTRREELHGVFNRVAKAERPLIERQPPRLDLRDVEDVVEDREQCFSRVVGRPDVFPLLGVSRRSTRSVIPITRSSACGSRHHAARILLASAACPPGHGARAQLFEILLALRASSACLRSVISRRRADDA